MGSYVDLVADSIGVSRLATDRGVAHRVRAAHPRRRRRRGRARRARGAAAADGFAISTASDGEAALAEAGAPFPTSCSRTCRCRRWTAWSCAGAFTSSTTICRSSS